jgi:hypothetical protein
VIIRCFCSRKLGEADSSPHGVVVTPSHSGQLLRDRSGLPVHLFEVELDVERGWPGPPASADLGVSLAMQAGVARDLTHDFLMVCPRHPIVFVPVAEVRRALGQREKSWTASRTGIKRVVARTHGKPGRLTVSEDAEGVVARAHRVQRTQS